MVLSTCVFKLLQGLRFTWWSHSIETLDVCSLFAQGDHHRCFGWWYSVWLLPPLVWCYICGECVLVLALDISPVHLPASRQASNWLMHPVPPVHSVLFNHYLSKVCAYTTCYCINWMCPLLLMFSCLLVQVDPFFEVVVTKGVVS